MRFPIRMTPSRISTGKKVKVVRMPASRSFLRAYATQAAMAKAIGHSGYDQTTMTNVQAWAVTPESKAITDNPATRSQKIREANANNCEMISQINTGLRGVGWVFKNVLRSMNGVRTLPIVPTLEAVSWVARKDEQ